MPITVDRIARLRAFGLSEYAARAYLALLDLGTTEARDVSSLSKVPASKIYHILDQLHEKRLVLILAEFPRKYAPVPFAEFLQRIHDEHEAAALAIERERTALLDMFAVVGDVPARDRGSVTFLRGRRNAMESFHDTLANAKEDALVLMSEGQASEPALWRDALAQAAARGVRMRVLAPGGRFPRARGRPVSLPAGAFAVVADGRRAILGHALPDDGHSSEGNDTAIHVDQAGIVALLAALLDAQWAAAETVSRPVVLDEEGPERVSAPTQARP